MLDCGVGVVSAVTALFGLLALYRGMTVREVEGGRRMGHRID